jgi:hypothetical protein
MAEQKEHLQRYLKRLWTEGKERFPSPGGNRLVIYPEKKKEY